jgi:CAAX prenyl protease-like protein
LTNTGIGAQQPELSRPEQNAAASSVPYVLPFGVFMALLALQSALHLDDWFDLVLRTVVLIGALALSRQALTFQTTRMLGSLFVGVGVFLVWIAPDVLFPHYRGFWLFQNGVLGTATSTLPGFMRQNTLALGLRSFRAIILVPIVEELFWRGWLMRWLIDHRFERVRLGAFTASSFWITAVLFASEHGPYWDVGLAAGIAYNWWMVRTKSIGDCVLAHAVTNALLSAYVIAGGHWQYWM